MGPVFPLRPRLLLLKIIQVLFFRTLICFFVISLNSRLLDNNDILLKLICQ